VYSGKIYTGFPFLTLNFMIVGKVALKSSHLLIWPAQMSYNPLRSCFLLLFIEPMKMLFVRITPARRYKCCNNSHKNKSSSGFFHLGLHAGSSESQQTRKALSYTKTHWGETISTYNDLRGTVKSSGKDMFIVYWHKSDSVLMVYLRKPEIKANSRLQSIFS